MVTTYTLTHPAPDGGPPFASSVVAPRPLPVVEACQLAAAKMGIWPSTFFSHELDYRAPVGDAQSAVHAVAARYSACGRCHLSTRRTQVSTIKGNPYATVACVGEGPGRDEDSRGVPFVGRAGRLQDELFREFAIDPQAVAWFDLVGCRPCDNHWADNRSPNLGEMLACSERTWSLLAAVRPRVVVCLGKEATAIFWDEPPKDVWSWHRVVPADAPDDWVMVGYARHPRYLAKVIGMASNYKEYAAARTFYGLLRDKMVGLTNVSAWRPGLRYLSTFTEPVVST